MRFITPHSLPVHSTPVGVLSAGRAPSPPHPQIFDPLLHRLGELHDRLAALLIRHVGAIPFKVEEALRDLLRVEPPPDKPKRGGKKRNREVKNED